MDSGNGLSFPQHLLLTTGTVTGTTTTSSGRDGSSIPEDLLVGESEGSIKCEYCHYRCSKKDRMRRHVNTVHYKERPFRCHLCESTFGRKDKIKRHLETVHSSEKPYKCEFCAHTTGRKDKIKEHVQSVHFKSRPSRSHKKKASLQPPTHPPPTTSAVVVPPPPSLPIHPIPPPYVQAILNTQTPLPNKPEFA